MYGLLFDKSEACLPSEHVEKSSREKKVFLKHVWKRCVCVKLPSTDPAGRNGKIVYQYEDSLANNYDSGWVF